MQYRRMRVKGGSYFFTVVTNKRRPILCHPENVSLMRNCIRDVINNHPFIIDAFVLLPDHLHCIWTLPKDDHDFPLRWRLIKSAFTRHIKSRYKITNNLARSHKQEQSIWQRRYWEHQISDELDFKNHVEYIHYNPVKHGLVNAPSEWPYSSFHKYVNNNIYQADWCLQKEIKFTEDIGRE